MYKIASITNVFSGTERITFAGDKSLTDFDIVIIDPSYVSLSFPKADVGQDNKNYILKRDAHVVNELIKRRREEVSTLLSNGKMVISFLKPIYKVTISSPAIKTNMVDNYSWLPPNAHTKITSSIINGSGERCNLANQKSLFATYFHALQKDIAFEAYINHSAPSPIFDDVFIINVANKIVGFSIKSSEGIIVFLPPFTRSSENDKRFIGAILQIAKGYFGTNVKSPPPDWVNSFSIPGVDAFDNKIRDFEVKITNLETKKFEVENELDNLNDFKCLLFETGHILEEKTVDAMNLLGFYAQTVPGENTDFDLILEAKEGRAIAEIEGKDNDAIHKKKIDQLLSAINQDAEEKDNFAKGILIGNHFRKKTPSEREEPFTKTVIRLAQRYEYALLTTVELYNAVIYFLENPDDEDCKKACRKALLETSGELVEFPLPKIPADKSAG